MEVTALDIARRFIGIKEAPGIATNPLILAMLQQDNEWPKDDEVSWCGAFMGFITHLLGLPRSTTLNARSWLKVGQPVMLNSAKPGFDVVILQRGTGAQPGPEVTDAPGHVGFFVGLNDDKVTLLGGNQGDAVSIASFPVSRVLGVRRLL
jgi:uncharacterized protein (TIGR02594 family)